MPVWIGHSSPMPLTLLLILALPVILFLIGKGTSSLAPHQPGSCRADALVRCL